MIPPPAQCLVRSLEQSALLGGDATQVETLATHMSWVLLAGPYAYKIKKPVDLGFADFSTLEKRRYFCNEELRVNRRLAPEWYLDVVPIYGTPEAPSLECAGEPIEYAVKMKRFPQEARLDRVLDRSRFSREHLDELVRQIAEFHARVEVDVNGRGFGTPEAVRKPMEANFEHLAEDVGDGDMVTRLDRLKQWSTEQSEARRQDFARRKQKGFIRECHGDMHLGNMFLQNDLVVIFDGIEFNENLRWIDVLSEVAFLVMDLEDRGRADLARRALNGYLEITGDYAGLAVTPYYLAYRALVRAKVAGIRLHQKGVAPRDRKRLQNELHGYLRLADAYTSPPPPKLIITHGVSGSGKTTGAQRIVEALGAVRLRSDVERKRLFGLHPLARTDTRLNEGLYTAETTRRCYSRLAELAEAVVRAGFTAVVDATFLDHRHRDMLSHTAASLSVPFRIIHFRADEPTLRRRLGWRKAGGGDASDADLAVLRHQLESCQPLREEERRASLDIDTAEAHWQETLIVAVRAWHAAS